jgi:hypothetical protein
MACLSGDFRFEVSDSRSKAEALGDEFGDVEDLKVVALGEVGSVTQHDRAVGARHHQCGSLGGGELGQTKFVHPSGILLPPILGDEKLRAAGAAALRILAVVVRLRQRNAAGT